MKRKTEIMKAGVLFTVALLVLSAVVVADTGEVLDEKIVDERQKLAEQLENDEDVKTMLDTLHFMTTIVEKINPDYMEAIKNGKNVDLENQIDLASISLFKILDAKLKDAADNVIEKYPELKDLSNCPHCGGGSNSIRGGASGTWADPECDYPSYVACLLVCISAGPYLYIFCSYLCMQAYCPSGGIIW